MRWIGPGKPNTWDLKKDIPQHWQHWAAQVTFRFCRAWIVRDENRRVYMENGEWAETFDFYLKTPGHVLGLRDLQTAANYEWAEEWRAAMHDRIKERLKLF
jgi:hypothetical protein